MNPPRTIRTIPNPASKELRRMSRKLIRALDAFSHLTIVFLALRGRRHLRPRRRLTPPMNVVVRQPGR